MGRESMLRAAALAVSACVACSGGSNGGTATASIDGRVVLPGVSDASGISVVAFGPTGGSATTAADGNYHIGSLLPGSYLLLATVESTVEHTQSVAVSAPGAAPNLAFTPVGKISGRVTLAGATGGDGGIAVYALEAHRATLTDDAGDYVLDDLPPGAYTVGATMNGYLPGGASGVAVTFRGNAEVATLDLQAGGGGVGARIAGIATLPPPGGAAGTAVSIEGTSMTTTTAADGSYAFSDVPAGVYTLRFANGAYGDEMPGVVALPGGNGFVIAGTLQPIPAIVVPRARRLVGFWPVGTLTSADGSEVALTWTDDARVERNAVAAVAGGATVPMPGTVLALAADGRTAAVLEERSGGTVVDLVATDGSSRRTVTSALAVSPRGIPRAAFTPDGGTCVFELTLGPDTTNALYTIYGVPVASGNAQVIASGATGLLVVAPAGGHILYQDAAGLEVVAVAGGAATMVADPSATKPSFTTDGTGVVYIGGGRLPFLVGIAGGAPAPISSTPVEQPPPQILEPDYRLSSDGQRMAFLIAGDVLVSAPLTGAPGVTFDRVSEWDLTSDSKYLVYRSGGITAAPIAAGAAGATFIEDGEALALSPDGKYVAYTATDAATQADVVHAALLPSGSPTTIAFGFFKLFTTDSAWVAVIPPSNFLGFVPVSGGAFTGAIKLVANGTTPTAVAGGVLLGTGDLGIANPTSFQDGIYVAPTP